ncbi:MULTISPECIES: hypothetical protein [unclassified Lactococcus]|uniref:hypothetical protein n=1 Tax=unclassified Lactococcus TaxID=2643510 RepID=UPI0011C8E34C|nr:MULTISPECIES: hypothetical protein [unclassified Lactococcus]MQW23095.1 hypothetical protein [Lactococcus sp. dk101]TXK44439.1 hypothetical protein FVP42_05685 [Lactococcus sp. dk310]TXK50248.1 hypothetical protein FVP43_05655 [Lactococcus sp. dk322]
MQIIEEGEQAFLKQLEVLLRIPEIREKDHQSLLYNNRESIEGLTHDIKGSMTLLMIFDNE